MKAKAQLFTPPAGSSMKPLANELQNAAAILARVIPEIMKVFGLSELAAQPAMVGVSVVNTISKQDLPGTLAPALLAGQRHVARLLADLMIVVGILNLKLEVESGDDVTLQKFFDAMKNTPSSVAGGIKLNVEEDPTGKSVLDESGKTK